MSESWFVLLISAGLYAAVRSLDQPEPYWGWPLAAGAVLSLAVTIRTAALLMIPVVILAMLLRAPALVRIAGGIRRRRPRGPDRIPRRPAGFRGRQRDLRRPLRARCLPRLVPLLAGRPVRGLQQVHSARRYGGPVPEPAAGGPARNAVLPVLAVLTGPDALRAARSARRSAAPVGQAGDPGSARRLPDARSGTTSAATGSPPSARSRRCSAAIPGAGERARSPAGVHERLRRGPLRAIARNRPGRRAPAAPPECRAPARRGDLHPEPGDLLRRFHAPTCAARGSGSSGAGSGSSASGPPRSRSPRSSPCLGLAFGTRRTRLGVLLFGVGGLTLLIAPSLTANFWARYTVPMAGPLVAAAAIAVVGIIRARPWRRAGGAPT